MLCYIFLYKIYLQKSPSTEESGANFFITIGLLVAVFQLLAFEKERVVGLEKGKEKEEMQREGRFGKEKRGRYKREV